LEVLEADGAGHDRRSLKVRRRENAPRGALSDAPRTKSC
jgi:hypothetical protein